MKFEYTVTAITKEGNRIKAIGDIQGPFLECAVQAMQRADITNDFKGCKIIAVSIKALIPKPVKKRRSA